MSAGEAYDLLRERAHGRVGRNEPIAPLTSYQLGGPAAVSLEAETVSDLEALAAAVDRTKLPLLVVGRGSNMLVSDRGFDGIAVRLGSGFRWTRAEGPRIEAGAGIPVPALAATAQSESLAGFEFAVAIPASFGGAIAMNAGAHGHSVSEVLASATIFDVSSAREETIEGERLGFDYRTSALPPGSIVTGGALLLRPGEADAIAAAMREAREWRRATQPIGLPNAGSVFKNPPGDAAGRLVEAVCGKGTAFGRARISEVHANFIVASEGATANDVYTLIRRIQRMVRENTGVELETEVKLIGIFEEAGDGAPAR